MVTVSVVTNGEAKKSTLAPPKKPMISLITPPFPCVI